MLSIFCCFDFAIVWEKNIEFEKLFDLYNNYINMCKYNIVWYNVKLILPSSFGFLKTFIKYLESFILLSKIYIYIRVLMYFWSTKYF